MAIRTPTQTRSKVTMERFIAAALRLVEAKRWEDISVAQLAAEAGSSVGAFYSRFGDKETLLEVLDDHYARAMTDLLEGFSRTPADGFAVSVTALLGDLVGLYDRHQGLIRTLVLTARNTERTVYAANTRRMRNTVPPVVERLQRCPDLPAGCDAAHLGTALAFTFSALREQILFPEAVPVRVRGKSQLINLLARSFTGATHALAET